MARFKVRDLMINVLPGEPERQELWGQQHFLRANSCLEACISGCHPAVTCTPTPTLFLQGFGQPEDLAALKGQLRQALAQVEAQERVHDESMQPQTLEEVTVLEEKLTAALEDLRARKAELQEEGSQRQG